MSSPPRILLRVLGPVRVTRVGDPDEAPLVTQPRRLAVLAYLMLARPRGLQARDTLLALLWPDADQQAGRHALRNALHGLRRALGDETFVVAGEAQVGLSPDQVVCDVLELEAELRTGQWVRALDRYDGELLQGFHISDAPSFEQWLDAERRRIHDAVLRAARAGIDSLAATGDRDATLHAVRRLTALAPDDEGLLRRLMTLLVAADDRGGALRAYDRFAERMRAEHGAAPAVETRRQAEALRAAARPRDGAGAHHAVPTPGAVTSDAVAAPGPAPIATWEDLLAKRRRRALSVASAALVVTVFAWRSASLERRGHPVAVAATVRALPNAGKEVLAARYRADTARYRRYLIAESQLEQLRLADARQSFQQIVDADPLYAPAWAGLSFAFTQSAFNDIPPSDALPRAEAAANRALALDSSLVEPRRSLIAGAMFGRWDLADTRRQLDAALARHPGDPELLNLLATWHRWRGEHDASIALKREALALYPLSPRYQNQLGWSLLLAHRCSDALEVFRRIADGDRAHAWSRLYLYHAYKCLGRMDEAAAALRESVRREGDSVSAHLLDPPLSPARRDSAMHAVFRRRLDRYFAARRDHWRTSTDAAVLYAEMRNADSALVWLDSMYAEHAMLLHIVPFDQNFDFMAGDPRFQHFLARLPWHPPIAVKR